MARLTALVVLVAALGAVAFAAGPGQSDTVFRTFRSPGVSLNPGEVANTDIRQTPLDWVQGAVAIRYFAAEVVDESGAPVPLSEIYVHHWLVFRDFEKRLGNSGPCTQKIGGTSQTFGIGAELRGTKYDLPYPYAILTDGTETWQANLHFIRIDHGVSDVQKCIECHCTDGTPNSPHGAIGCSQDMDGYTEGCGSTGHYCWGASPPSVDTRKTYYLEYTIGYVPITRDIIPVDVFLLDVTATTMYDCEIEYQIPAGSAPHILESYVSIPANLDVVLVEAHQHIGGQHFSITHSKRGSDKEIHLCNNIPQYGNGTTVGNEKGFVVSISACTFEEPHTIPGDHVMKLKSIYTNRTLGGGQPEHEGVMGLVWMAAVKRECSKPKTCGYIERPGATANYGSPNTHVGTKVVNSLEEAKSYCDLLTRCGSFVIEDPATASFPQTVDFFANSELYYMDDEACSFCNQTILPTDSCFHQSSVNATCQSCQTCGSLSGNDPSGMSQCVTCPEGFEIDVMHSDCSGRCVKQGTASVTVRESGCVGFNLCTEYCGKNMRSFAVTDCKCEGESDTNKAGIHNPRVITVAVAGGLVALAGSFLLVNFFAKKKTQPSPLDYSRSLTPQI